MSESCDDLWDVVFIDKVGTNKKQVYDLIYYANAFGNKDLLNLGCDKVASFIKGQPLDKIKDLLKA